MKKIVLGLIMLLMCCVPAWAAPLVGANPNVAVIDFGEHVGQASGGIGLENVGGTAADYIMDRLVTDGRVVLKDVAAVREQLKALGIETKGLINPVSAKILGEQLGVEYVIYGNVNDVSVSETGVNALTPLPSMGGGKATVHTVKCHIIARVMDVKSGFIIAAAKGEGYSKSSNTDITAGSLSVTIGKEKVTQQSVHNAIEKAATETTDMLISKLFGTALVNKKREKVIYKFRRLCQ